MVGLSSLFGQGLKTVGPVPESFSMLNLLWGGGEGGGLGGWVWMRSKWTHSGNKRSLDMLTSDFNTQKNC